MADGGLSLSLSDGPRAALESAQRRVAQDPNNAEAAIELSVLLMGRGELEQAELHARNAVRLAPLNPRSHNALAMVLTEAEKLQAGEFHYRRVLALAAGEDPILLANLAWNLKQQGRMDDARALYRASVAQAPSVRQTLLGWARLEEADRQLERAREILDDAERRFPDDPEFLKSRAVVLERLGDAEAALSVLDRLERRMPGGLTPDALSTKAGILDRLGRFDAAFDTAAKSKRKLREQTAERYRADQANDLIGRLRGFFTTRRLGILPRAALREEAAQPIFILGFPRSGTTLLEQALSAHPEISAGGELQAIAELANGLSAFFGSPLPYPEALSELWMAEHHDGLDTLRDRYLRIAERTGALGSDGRWFTDKMPLNETHLGLISLIFPYAPLIHLLRHPLDVVLSVFFNHLTHGFCCAYELETAARHYVAVMELVEHYLKQDRPRYLAVKYESLVDDHEAAVREVLDFIGAPFNSACLSFHENRRYARTASYAQVTERLYRRSCGRYRSYWKHLLPVVPILEPVIERLGYQL